MGVPKFYRWISERYPCLSQVLKEHQVSRERGFTARPGPAAEGNLGGQGPEPAGRERAGAGRAAPSAARQSEEGGRRFGAP